MLTNILANVRFVEVKTVNVHDAKTNLSRLLKDVEAGEEIIIARDGQPVARLVPVDPELFKPRPIGGFEDKIWMAPDFDEPDYDVFPPFDEDVEPIK
jgi:prevent-host-death family protein